MTMLEKETTVLGLVGVGVGVAVGVGVQAGAGMGVRAKEDGLFQSHGAKVEAEGEGEATSAHVLRLDLAHIVETIPVPTAHGQDPLHQLISILRI
jgi:hypothetical protein